MLDPVINNSLQSNNNISFDLNNFQGELPGDLKNRIFFVSPEKEIRLGHLWNFEKFEKTGVYASYNDASYNFGSDLIFCFVAIDPFVVYEAESYSGIGGIFCKREMVTDNGFVIEPLKNYLKTEFPVYWEN
jgi:hypothetical protein